MILVAAAVPKELSGVRRNGDGRVRWMTAGMGPRAADAVRERLGRERFSLVVSTGFAGGVRPGFQVGDLVMASEVVRTDSGRRFRPAESVPGLQGACSFGTFVTLERPLRDPKRKQELGSTYGAIAVEMETAGVAEAAEAAGVPWVSLRAILDPMEVPLAAGSAREALGLALRPGRWKELNSFWAAIRRASESLGRGLELLTKITVPGTAGTWYGV
ncbi:MAG: hypothetical protein HYZ94_01185 [Candidatus Omnitrophica bacterium]|nr:hypothetical protein [Candidatus Omnitrophota bacterium]